MAKRPTITVGMNVWLYPYNPSLYSHYAGRVEKIDFNYITTSYAYKIDTQSLKNRDGTMYAVFVEAP